MKLLKSIFIVILCVVFFYLFNQYIYNQKQSVVPVTPYRATLEGEYLCLPTQGTEECLFGIKTDSGEYYAITFYLMSQSTSPLEVGMRLRGQGVVTPRETLSAAQWHDAEFIEGIFSVTNALEIIE